MQDVALNTGSKLEVAKETRKGVLWGKRKEETLLTSLKKKKRRRKEEEKKRKRKEKEKEKKKKRKEKEKEKEKKKKRKEKEKKKKRKRKRKKFYQEKAADHGIIDKAVTICR